MNAAPYTHLVWKEYRAIRGFWIALIALAIFMELLVLAFSQDRDWATQFVYNIALGTPVFFAIGCIGTAYAIEKEDGTFEWLRSSPASDAQLFVSKVGLCFVATLAMFAALWLVTRGVLAAPPDQAGVLPGMLGLWLLAAAEALAWGLLFSLLSARPLVAIVLALFATSTAVHVLSWIVQPLYPDQFQYTRYVTAIPLRLGVLAVVATADVYFGLRWLGSDERVSLLSPREQEDASARRPATKADIGALLHRRDRFAILGRLTWQHLRQSGRLMFTLAALQVLMSWIAANSGLNSSQFRILPLVPMLGLAALMGASVFQPDQQRANFRFFVEHNVPPRYVWLTRVVPWLVAALAATLLSALAALGWRTLAQVAWFGLSTWQAAREPWNYSEIDRYHYAFLREIVPVLLLSGLTLPAFAAGQWASMFVRSGLLAGFFSLLLAALLTTWAWLVYATYLSWTAFLFPIPLVLFWATWLRAPDWILENTSWPARLKAGGAVLVPTLLLLTFAPLSRIEQIPDAVPRFNPAAYVAEITPAALETGDLYRQANERYQSISADTEQYLNYRWVITRSKQRVSENEAALKLVLQATQRPSCALANPAKLTNWPVVPYGRFTSLTGASAYELAREEKLAESLDRYFAAFTVERQTTSFAPRTSGESVSYRSIEILQLLTRWGAHHDQTEQQLREAIARLEQLDVRVLNWEDAIRSNYILCQRMLDGDDQVVSILYPGKNSAQEVARVLFNLRVLPWERARERRSLNLYTAEALGNLQRVRADMQEGQQVGSMADSDYVSPNGVFDGGLSLKMRNWGFYALTGEISFETVRRATILILACQAYRLQHGALPERLEQLRDDGLLTRLPNDPMSGRPFVYFPQGVPEPRNATERQLREKRGVTRLGLSFRSFETKTPCLWSPGVELATRVRRDIPDDPSTEEVYYLNRYIMRQTGDAYYLRLSEYDAWMRGEWFPIPDKK